MSKCTCLAHGIWTDPDGICHECGEHSDKLPYTRDSIRFWIYWRDGVVRVTVPRDGSLEIGYGGLTDEGWSHYTETFEHDSYDDTLTRTVSTDSADCDGRHSHNTVTKWHVGGPLCPMYEFASDGEMVELPGVLQPDWELADRFHRDFAAEAAGY